VLVNIVVVVVRAFVWILATLGRHLRDHELHDREHEPHL
jgi:hypothetical protein